jgi:hypothetical protein
MSSETVGGDLWYSKLDTVITTTAVATENLALEQDSPGGPIIVSGDPQAPNHPFGPLDFIYAVPS